MFPTVREAVKRVKTTAKRAAEPVVRARATRPSFLTPATWGLAVNDEQNLALHGLDLADLAQRHGTPLAVVDAERQRATAARFLAQPADGPRFDTFYSYKSNPVPAVLKLLDECGIGAEVTSELELRLALDLGVEPRRIIMNGPGWSRAAMELAVQHDLYVMNLNHREMLDEFAEVARAAGRRPRIGLRITTAESWSGQFGIPIAQAVEAYEHARALDCFEVVGIHLHLGGMVRDNDRLSGPLDQLLDLVGELRGHGFELEVMDIGGGLASPTVYNPSARDYTLNQALGLPLREPDPAETVGVEEFVAAAGAHIARRYREWGAELPTVLLEPGRAMTSDSMFILASVMRTFTGLGRDQMVLDAGYNQLPQMDSEFHHMMPVRQGRAADHTWAVVGPTCAPFDVLWKGWQAPDLAAGEVVALMDAGAYFIPLSNSFSFTQPAIVMVDAEGDRIVRRRESIEDVFDRDIG